MGDSNKTPPSPVLIKDNQYDKLRTYHDTENVELHGCSILPEELWQLTHLRVLKMENCSFQSIPDSIGQLAALRELRIAKCGSLTSLPESLGQLKALQTLVVVSCSTLTSLPESLWQLAALQKLEIGCDFLASLSVSLGQLAALQQLRIDCYSLTSLPESLGQLSSLQELMIASCQQLKSIPDSLGQLAALQKLRICCYSLESIPESLGQLAALRELEIESCDSLTNLPKSIGQLTTLQKLVIVRCKSLTNVPESIGQLTALQELVIDGSSLTSLPQSIGQLTALQELVIRNCSSLTSLPQSIGQLTALQTLEMEWCSGLTSIPESIQHLCKLCQLSLTRCTGLTTLPESMGQLQSLKTLLLDDCSNLLSIPESFGQLTALRLLNLSGCTQLAGLPQSVEKLKDLQIIWEHTPEQEIPEPEASTSSKLPTEPSGKKASDSASAAAAGCSRKQVAWSSKLPTLQQQAPNQRQRLLFGTLLLCAGLLTIPAYIGFHSGQAAVVSDSGDSIGTAIRLCNGAAFAVSLACMLGSVVGLTSLAYMPVYQGVVRDDSDDLQHFLSRCDVECALLTKSGTRLLQTLYRRSFNLLVLSFYAMLAACVLVWLKILGMQGPAIASVTIIGISCVLAGLTLWSKRQFRSMLSGLPRDLHGHKHMHTESLVPMSEVGEPLTGLVPEPSRASAPISSKLRSLRSILDKAAVAAIIAAKMLKLRFFASSQSPSA